MVDGAGEVSRGRGDRMGGRRAASTPPGGRGGRTGDGIGPPLGDLLWTMSDAWKVLTGRGGTAREGEALASARVSVGEGVSGGWEGKLNLAYVGSLHRGPRLR